MMRSMFSGVSGIRNHQTRMDVIGNNIANVNTVGYKKSRVTFQDMLSQTIRGAAPPQGGKGGINPQQVGLGMNVNSIDTLHTQGSSETTGKTTDLMIDGDGFFVVGEGEAKYYTRAGNFDFDSVGNLVNPSGQLVQGWMAETDGSIDTTQPILGIQIPKGQSIQPAATSSATLLGNLDAGATTGTQVPAAMTVYDSLGQGWTINVVFTKAAAARTWNISVTDPGFGTAAGTSFGSGVDGTISLASNALGSSGNNYKIVVDASTGTDRALSTTVGNATAAIGAGADGTVNITTDAAGPNGNKYTVTVATGTGNNSPLAATLSGNDIIVTLATDGSGNPDAAANTAAAIAAKIDALAGVSAAATGTGATAINAAVPQTSFTQTITVNLAVSGGALDATQNKASLVAADINNNVTGVTATASGTGATAISAAVASTAFTGGSDGTTVTGGPLVFDATGMYLVGSPLTVTGSAPNANPLSISVDVSKLSQFDGESSVKMNEQDGYSSGVLNGYSVDKAGIITGRFTNGLTKQLAQVVMANFNNPAGMVKVGENLFASSTNSGSVQYGTAGTGGMGAIAPGKLEMSNVDLSQEFTDMIITQRGFQANSRIISVSDEMLQELVSLKR